jgi:hypothetical protein
VIKPTVGRKVWYRPTAFDKSGPGAMQSGDQPLDATVVYVHGDRMVNLFVVDAVGRTFAKTSVTLLQDDDAPPPIAGGGGYAEWMPYQQGQAKAQAATKE